MKMRQGYIIAGVLHVIAIVFVIWGARVFQNDGGLNPASEVVTTRFVSVREYAEITRSEVGPVVDDLPDETPQIVEPAQAPLQSSEIDSPPPQRATNFASASPQTDTPSHTPDLPTVITDTTQNLPQLTEVAPQRTGRPRGRPTGLTSAETQEQNTAPVAAAPPVAPTPREPAAAIPSPTDQAVNTRPPTPAATSDTELAAAIAAAVGQVRQAPPSLTRSEVNGLIAAVNRCWIVDPNSDLAAVKLSVAFELGPDGVPVENSVRQFQAQGGTPQAQRAAFEAARSAILACGADGYDLPAEKYAQWKEVVIDFNQGGGGGV